MSCLTRGWTGMLRSPWRTRGLGSTLCSACFIQSTVWHLPTSGRQRGDPTLPSVVLLLRKAPAVYILCHEEGVPIVQRRRQRQRGIQ